MLDRLFADNTNKAEAAGQVETVTQEKRIRAKSKAAATARCRANFMSWHTAYQDLTLVLPPTIGEPDNQAS